MQIITRRLDTTTATVAALGGIAVLFSIAVCEMLFAVALLLLLLSRRRLEFPSRLRYPLLAFIGWTLLSLAFSDAPLSGLFHMKKIALFLIILLLYNVYGNRRQIQQTFRGLALAATIAGIFGLVQFVHDYTALRRAGVPFYRNYITHQITGFMGHWMTFSGELMLVAVLLCALLLFSGKTQISRWWWLCLVPILLALLASFTRGVWLGTLAGLTYLLVRSRRPALSLLIPAAVLLLYLSAPSWLQHRERSIFNARTDSSNRARIVMLHTGLAMIAAHPWFGLGPERIGPEFLRYKPASLPLPPGWYGHLHDDYLQIAAERGIPCLLLLLWLFFEIAGHGILMEQSGAQKDSGKRAIGHAMVAVTLALMVGGLFEFNVGDSEVWMLYLFIISAAYAWDRLERAGAARAEGSAMRREGRGSQYRTIPPAGGEATAPGSSTS